MGFKLFIISVILLFSQAGFGSNKESLKEDCYGFFNNPQSCTNLGFLEQKQGNISEARKAFMEGCDGDSWACVSLGYLEKEQGNIPEAREAFMEGCDSGHSLGCFNLNFLK